MEDRQRPKPTGTNRPTQTHTPTPTPHTKGTKGGRNKKGNTTPPHQGGTPHRAQPRVHYADHHQPTPHPPEQTNETAGGPEDHNHPQHHRATPTRAPHHPTTRLGGHSGEATPGPIPNPEAKTPSANGTAPARTRKSRTPPSTHHPPTTTHKGGGGGLCVSTPVPPPHDGGLMDAAVDCPPIYLSREGLVRGTAPEQGAPPFAQIHDGSSMCQCQKV